MTLIPKITPIDSFSSLRTELNKKHHLLHLGESGISGDFVNAFSSFSLWFGTPQLYAKWYSHIWPKLQGLPFYRDWSLFTVKLVDILTPEDKKLLFEAEDIKLRVDAIDKIVKELRKFWTKFPIENSPSFEEAKQIYDIQLSPLINKLVRTMRAEDTANDILHILKN